MLAAKRMTTCLVLSSFFFMGASPARAAGNSAVSEMVDLGGGILKQAATGLEWAQSDNGSDIDWSNAGKYCADKKRALCVLSS